MKDSAYSEMKQLFYEIAREVMRLAPDFCLLRSWGAQGELWLRNQIALQLHRKLGAHIECEAKYPVLQLEGGDTIKSYLDLYIVRPLQAYCMEIKVQNGGPNGLIASLTEDVVKINRFFRGGASMPEVQKRKTAVRCVFAVATSTDGVAKLQAIFHRASLGDPKGDPNSIFQRDGGGFGVLLMHIDNRRT